MRLNDKLPSFFQSTIKPALNAMNRSQFVDRLWAEAAIGRHRRPLMSKHRVATTFGYGPRYLHSTGQLHKGGPNTGVFLELVDRMEPDVPIPEKPFSFGTLAKAQAIGDMESLSTHQRHAVRVQLGRDQAATVNAITAALTETASSGCRAASKKRRKVARR